MFFYFDKFYRLVGISVFFVGNYVVVVIIESKFSCDDIDIMLYYIQEDSCIVVKLVCQWVVDVELVNYVLWFFNLKIGEKNEFKYFNLLGYNDDVLVNVKVENVEVKGELYEVNCLLWDIMLLQSWYWIKFLICWYKNGNVVVVMFEVWDNKDCWIVIIDLVNKMLEN